MKTIMTVTIIFIAVYFAVSIGIGIYSRKAAVNVDNFVLGGRNIGPWISAFAYGTTYFSAVIFVGYAGQFGWNFGLSATWIGIGNAIIGSLLPWIILGRRTRIMTQHIGSRTMPDFFGIRYDSPALRIAASIIVFIFLIPYTASLYNGLSSLFALAFDIEYYWVIIIMAALTGIYVVLGGYLSAAINNAVQAVVMLVGIFAVVLAVLSANGGLSEAVAALSAKTAELDPGETIKSAYTSLFGPQPLSLLTVIILTSFGTWGLPQMVSKFYSIKSEDMIRKGAIISTVFAIIIAGGCYFLGGFGRLYDINVAEVGFDAIIPTILLSLKSNTIIALVILLVLAASMSTLASLVLASSSTITLDMIVPIKKKKQLTEGSKVTIMRLFIVFFIIVSAALAIVKDMFGFTFIAQMMGVSWGALAGAFLAPFMYGLYWRRTTKAAVWANFIFGVGVMTAQLIISATGTKLDGILGFIFSSSIRSGSFAMLGGLIIVPLVSLLTKAPDKEKLDPIFSCYAK